ncbi:MAG: hypothetical protein M3Q39_15965 [Actinomycetota bacterium]|nr:hypothetical protein [Actinomycetota bacterium]
MTFRLPYPWIDDDPQNLPQGTVVVSRLAVKRPGLIMLQGRATVSTPGAEGAVRAFVAQPWDIANLIESWVTEKAYGGSHHFLEGSDPWEELHERLAPYSR